MLLISPFNVSYITSIYDTEHDKTNKMNCAPKRRLRSAWTSAQSDQSPRCVAKNSIYLHDDREDYGQTEGMPRLICLYWAHMSFCWLVGWLC